MHGRFALPSTSARRPARTFLVLLALLSLLASVGPSVLRAQAPDPEPPAASPDGPTAQRFPGADRPSSARRFLGPPAATTAVGPLYDLEAVAESLGVDYARRAESGVLTLGDTRVVLGPDNPMMLVGSEVVPLSQPPRGERALELEREDRQLAPGEDPGALLVPVDALEKSIGAFLGWSFERVAGSEVLSAVRRRARLLDVAVDVVRLQGVSTVVLRFADRLDYRLERDRSVRGGAVVEVIALRDRLRPAGPTGSVDSPLVRGVEVLADRVRIELAEGAGADGYVLENPFRLVFDVVPRDDAPSADQDPSEPRTAPRPPRPRRGSSVSTIVIDPGHGGSETGAVGRRGSEEKDLTLDLARQLRNRLVQRLPVKVVLTRDEDANLPLDTRAAIANQNKADLFLSIHLNSWFGPRARGAETYFLSMEASDSRAARSAERENASPEDGDGATDADAGRSASGEEDPLYDLQLILWDLAQTRHLSESQRVAQLIQEELDQALGIPDRGVKQAPFRVLMGAAMPAVLVELGYLSNPEEEARLLDPAYQDQLVDALVRAVTRWRAEVEGRAGGRSSEPSPSPAPSSAPDPGEPR